jgi:hypothetical protein
MMKSKKRKSNSGTSISTRNVGGSLVVGDDNTTIERIDHGSTVIISGSPASQNFNILQPARFLGVASLEEIESLERIFQELVRQTDTTILGGARTHLVEKTGELKSEINRGKPDVNKLVQIKEWFGKNAPAMLGSVISILTHPVVGKLVEAAGEYTLSQFRLRLGLPK